MPNFSNITTKHLKAALILFAVFVYVGGYFFVKSALKEGTLKIKEKQVEERAISKKPVTIDFIITYQNLGRPSESFKLNLENTNTVLDIFEELRSAGDLTYEKIAYTYGTEIDTVNGVTAPEGYNWRIYATAQSDKVDDLIRNLDLSEEEISVLEQVKIRKTDITFIIDNLNLIDGAVYELSLSKF